MTINNMEKQKRIKTGGRKRKNETNTKITFKPSQEALNIYNSWTNKARNFDKLIVDYGEDIENFFCVRNK